MRKNGRHGHAEKPERPRQRRLPSALTHGTKFPYYVCRHRGCEKFGKSIARAKVEDAFEEMLRQLVPSPELFALISKLFRKRWDEAEAKVKESRTSMKLESDASSASSSCSMTAPTVPASLRRGSGTTAAGRDALADAIDFCREGDTLMVTRLDRFARSSVDLHNLVDKLDKKGVKFKCLQQAGIDTDSGMGKLVLAILGAVAAFETDIRKERQREGIDKAKANGIYKGRKPSVDVATVRKLRDSGVKPTEIAKQLKIGRASVYRALTDLAATT